MKEPALSNDGGASLPNATAFAAMPGSAREPRVDANVEAVRAQLLARSKVGLRKYGTTTERTDMEEVGWLRHLQEELLDAAVYCEAEIQRLLRRAGHSPSEKGQP